MHKSAGSRPCKISSLRLQVEHVPGSSSKYTSIYTVSFVIVIKFILQKNPLNCGLYLFLFSKVKSLGAADSDDDDSAASWVAKSRKEENEKSLAEKRVSYHHSSYNLEKVLNFSSRLEKSLNSVNVFTFSVGKCSGSDGEC